MSDRPVTLAGLTMSTPASELNVGLTEHSNAQGQGLGSLLTKPPAITGISSIGVVQGALAP